jgi:Arc/MetJ-type ribon-helix-helix transcriptional regulator
MTLVPQEMDFSRGRRGAIVPPGKGKTRITIRLDDNILDWFRAQVDAAGGGNYQSLINEALREHIQRTAEPLEETLRRVLREEHAQRHRQTGNTRHRPGTARGKMSSI